MGPFSESKEMIFTLFLPVQVMSGQCIVIILLSKLQKFLYGIAYIPSCYLWLGLISSVLSADQLRKLFIRLKFQAIFFPNLPS